MKTLKQLFVMFIAWLVLFGITFIAFCAEEGLSDAQLDARMKYSMLIALVIAVVGVIIVNYNKTQKTRAYANGFKADVAALSERRDHQLDQANKVLDKYLEHGKETRESEERSLHTTPIKKAEDFKKLVETNPKLSGNEAVVSLMNQINKVEDELVRKKEQYNACVAEYNSAIHSFPLVLIKKIAKLEDYDLTPETDSVLNEEAVSDEDLGI